MYKGIVVLVMSTFGFLAIGNRAIGQISSGQVMEKKPDTTDYILLPLPTKDIGVSNVYVGVGVNTAFRTLAESNSYFAEPIGIRSDEFAANRWIYQVGFRNRFTNLFTLDAGFQLDRYGIGYSYKALDSDSAFTYAMTFSYVSIPLQVFVTYGTKFRWHLGGGIQPLLATSYKYSSENTFANGTKVSNSLASVESLNPFTINVLLSAGFEWKWGRNSAIYFLPSYVYGLSNVYSKQEPYCQKWHGLNYKFGLVFQLDNKGK
jgi:hypothetical protein